MNRLDLFTACQFILELCWVCTTSPFFTTDFFRRVEVPPGAFPCDSGAAEASDDFEVLLIGDGDALGGWQPRQALELTRALGALGSGYWMADVILPTGVPVKYKYLLMNSERRIKWESTKSESRSIVPRGTSMRINDGCFGKDTDGVWVDEGWLSSDTQIRLRVLDFCATDISSLNLTSQSQLESQSSHENDRDLPWRHFLAVFNEEQSKTFDTVELEAISDNVLRPIATNDITIFLPTHQDARVHVSIYTSNANSIQKIGHVLVTGRMLNGTKGELVLPVADMFGGSLGELSVSFLIVTPFAHKNNNLNTLWMSYRSSKPVGLSVGHRGCGINNVAPISENTVLSFLTAAQFGADYVEFDVQLTRDMVPVIHHDFEVDVGGSRVPVCTITKREFKAITPPSEHYEAGESLNEIRERLRLQHVGRPRSKSTSDLRGIRLLQKADGTQVEPNRPAKSEQTTSQPRAQTHDAFATLKDALRLVPIETGFLIEVKYPTLEYQQRHHIVYPDRNSYADAVLTKIFDPLTTTPTNRPIIIISFDADMCTILAAKQPRYPIMFVIGCDDPQFGTDAWRRANPEVEAADTRTQTIEHAAVFAKQVGLRGVVCDSQLILDNPALVSMIHDKNLLLMTYGKANSVEASRTLLKGYGVDSLILDGIAHITRASRKKQEVSNLVMAELSHRLAMNVADGQQQL